MKTLIINYASMKMGGIETYFSELMLYSISQGYRVIWITSEKAKQEAFFKSISENSHIEKCYYKKNMLYSHSKLKFDADEAITMLSCEPLMYIRGEQLLKHINVKEKNHFLCLPHYTGNIYYPERFFKNTIFYRCVLRYFSKNAIRLNESNALYAFSLVHLDNFEKNYNISIENKKGKELQSIYAVLPLDEESIKKKADNRRICFTILSCSRLDFPHKGYILGLVDIFASLKIKYPECKLVIVGDGPGKEQLYSKIMALDDSVSQDIRLTGTLTREELFGEMRDAHMNVGVAGALAIGASLGVPSINVRHYSNSCETYGFYSDNGCVGVKDSPGEDAYSYIEKMIICEANEYLNQCKKDYMEKKNNSTFDPEYFFKQNNKNKRGYNFFDYLQAAIIWYGMIFIQGVFKVPGCDNGAEK